MKIISVHIDAFGKLTNCDINFRDGFNAILQQNSFGKTTIAQFIRAVLYGHPRSNAEIVTAYEPWNWAGTHKYGGYIIYEEEGRQYRLERHFGKTPSAEEVRLTDVATGGELDAANIGRRLLGIDADSFIRSAYIPQETVALASSADFERKLSNQLFSVDDSGSFDVAEKRLTALRDELRSPRGKGLLPELEKRSRELNMALFDGKKAIDSSATMEERLKVLSEEIKEGNATLQKLNGEVEEAKRGLTLSENRTEKAQIDELKTALAIRKPLKFNILYIVLATALLIGGVVLLALSQVIFGIALAAAGVVVGIAAVFFGKFVKNYNGETEKLRGELNSILQQYSADNPAQYKDRVARLSAAIGEINAQQLAREREIAATEVKIKTILNSCDIAELASQLAIIEDKRQQAEYKYSVVLATLQLLAEAKNSLAVSYLPRLNKLSSEYLAKFTSGEFDSIVADKDFAVSIEEKGVTKPHRYFSRGVRELALFCFKLALSREIYGGKIPLLILDDVFVNLDEEKFILAVKELLHTDIAVQIIYFTCHERINKVEIAARRPQ
jgi:uncharacterized protein YhaN